MYFIKTFILIIGILSVAQAEDSKSNFISPNILEVISSADSLYASRVTRMYLSPAYVPPGKLDSDAKKIPNPEYKTLINQITESKKINPETRLKNCHYQPGIKISFVKNSNIILTILACFNCNIWALSESDSVFVKEQKIIAYGDLLPYRSDLIKISKNSPGTFFLYSTARTFGE